MDATTVSTLIDVSSIIVFTYLRFENGVVCGFGCAEHFPQFAVFVTAEKIHTSHNKETNF